MQSIVEHTGGEVQRGPAALVFDEEDRVLAGRDCQAECNIRV